MGSNPFLVGVGFNVGKLDRLNQIALLFQFFFFAGVEVIYYQFAPNFVFQLQESSVSWAGDVVKYESSFHVVVRNNFHEMTIIQYQYK